MGRLYGWVGPDERRLIAVGLAEGASISGLAARFGCSRTTIARIRDEAMLLERRAGHSRRQLSFEERERIFEGVVRGESDAEIARALGRHRSTIGREIKRTCPGERWRYRPLAAERRRARRARRPKPGKLASNPRLLAAVEQGLAECWSPEQISARLRREYPDDRGMRISHETIYRALYVQSRGELRRQLARQLRTGRDRRKARGRVETRGRIPDMVPISQRPPEVADRAVPGHWEGDLLLGAHGRSSVATLVERRTRYVMLARLGGDRRTERVIEALRQQIRTLPAHLARSLTWDQGRELAAHKTFTVQTGVSVYFCDPHSPWQRGSNENTNGLLRQYLPKGTDLTATTQLELDEIARQLNGRPRKTLDWMTPAEKIAELLADPPRCSPGA
ncbi:MAG: IS30 family transposase [Solirubrobacterales bacterium]|nr:IS30 family transposase [Solirubrobacterales bacterium]